MESAEQLSPCGACNLLGVPGLISVDVDDDDDECDIVIGIRPKSSPLPRRKSSLSDEDSEPGPPLCGSRRVSFADAKGLSLVQVKEFGIWDVPKLPEYDSSEGKDKVSVEYIISPLNFSLPLSREVLFDKVRDQKLELESIQLLPGTTILKGVIRVLNISFDKAVYVRTSLDSWSSHFDLLTEYMPGSSEGLTDCFSFKLTLIPPFGEQGAGVDFCLRYETSVGTFWANNDNRNYMLCCHQRAKELREQTQKENVKKKSCLKSVGQNFSTLENNPAMETSLPESDKTDVSKQGQEVDTIQAKQISDAQSGTSEEDGENILTKSRRNCSRRSRRKAARMARVQDYFAQRNGAGDAERDDSPPEAKQTAQEEKHSDVQTLSKGSSAAESSQLLSDSLGTRSEPLTDVQQNTAPAHDYTSNSQTEKSESINLADSATLTRGESASEIPDNTLHSNDEPAPAEHPNINKCVSRSEGSSQKEGFVCCECKNSNAAEPAGSDFTGECSEGLVSQSNSFTFGTVVAPLYRQVFERAGAESQCLADRGNPVKATPNVEDFTNTERKEKSRTVPTDARADIDKALADETKTLQSSIQEGLDSSVISSSMKQEGTSFGATPNNVLVTAQTLQDLNEMQRCTNAFEVPKTNAAETEVESQAVDIINTYLLNPEISTESSDLQGDIQEDIPTNDLQSQTTAETAQLSEQACTQTTTKFDEKRTQSETKYIMTSLETSLTSPSERESDRLRDEADQQTSSTGAKKEEDVGSRVTPTVVTSEDNKTLEDSHELNHSCTDNPADKDTHASFDSSLEAFEGKDVTSHRISSETQGETKNLEGEKKEVIKSHIDETKLCAESNVTGDESVMMMSDHHIHGDMIIEPEDEDTLKQGEMIESAKIELCELEDSRTEVTTEIKNWEMMVEEEEEEIDISEEICLKAGDIEAVEEDHVEQLEGVGEEATSENRDTTEDDEEKSKEELMWEIIAVREKNSKAEAANLLKEKQRFGEEDIWGIVAGTERDGVENENVQATTMIKTTEEEELTEKTELGREKHLGGIQEAKIRSEDVQEEEEIKGEEEMHLKDEDEAGTEWGGEIREENLEEENPDCEEDILVFKTGESKITQIEERENEAGCSEERLERTQGEVEDGLSAWVNNVQDKSSSEKNITGELQNAHIQTEMNKEEDFQGSEKVTHDISKAEREENESTAAEGGSLIFVDGPEVDKTGHDGASSESDSDDEVELYMHCLRAVHTGAQAQRDRNKDAGFGVGRRPSVNRSKLLSTRMPSISESLDEDQHVGCLQDNHVDTDFAADFKPSASPLPEASEPENLSRHVSWWRETFSCRNIGKTLLYAILLVIFLVVAYHYDFLACFGLYMISLVWLWCQGERQPVKNSKKIA
ncbi:nestin isoform X1 [Labrus mixtus]|uniref:nestin isoform X1 n=1 Tax=Labrus mixtus TaxID=508554 RepID=UPI0029C057C6|nr:nestin isoform X1 [Labrus mixtus]